MHGGKRARRRFDRNQGSRPGAHDLNLSCQDWRSAIDGFVRAHEWLAQVRPDVVNARPVRTVPISINTVQHPLPSPARCLRFGQSIGRAIESYDKDLDVLVLGTGGLSHQVDGERAGFINREFDLIC
jgi:hypothetical protein